MIPTRRLVGLAAIPFALGVLAAFVPPAVAPMIAFDVVLAVVAVADALLARGALRVVRSVSPVQAVGRPFDVTLTVENVGRRALSARLTDDAPGPAEGLPASFDVEPGERVVITYRARVEQRGEHAFGPVTARWRSPLGLWERQRRHPVDTALRVYPNFAQLRRYGLQARPSEQRMPVRARRRPGGENEFERLRPYVPGDPYRHVDWRATARRGALVSREFGQEMNQNLIFLLDCGRMMTGQSAGMTTFDHALNAALMLGQVALRRGDRVGLLAFDREVRAWLPPRGGARAGSRLIRGTYDVFPRVEEPDYALAFHHLATRVRRRSLVVLLTHVVDEPNAALAETLLGALAGRHLPVCVWLRDADVEALADAETRNPRVDPYVRGAAAELLAWRERSLAGLRRRGALVVDCAPGDVTGELLSAYLEVKARRLL